MALASPEQAIEALRAALDQVPLTADQRQKTLSEFALRIGQALPMNFSSSLPVSSPLFGAPVVSQKASLQEALDHALQAAHEAAPTIAPADRQSVQRELVAQLESRLETTSDTVDRSAIQAILQENLAHRPAGKSIPPTKGFFFALIEAVVLSVGLSLVLFALYGKAIIAQPLILTVADIFILFVGCQLLGTLHEKIWFSTTHVLNIFTLLRGAASPLSIPLGLLLKAHEYLWSDYAKSAPARILRSLISPITVPIGAIWTATGFCMHQVERLTKAQKMAKKIAVSALKEEKKIESKPITPPAAPIAA